MRFLGNLIGSAAIAISMLFMMTALLPAPPLTDMPVRDGPVFDLGLSSWQRYGAIVGVLALTLLIAFRTPPWGLNLWHMRLFILFFALGVPMIAMQAIVQYRAIGSVPGMEFTLMGMWVFVLGGVIYRTKLRAALWLNPKAEKAAV